MKERSTRAWMPIVVLVLAGAAPDPGASRQQPAPRATAPKAVDPPKARAGQPTPPPRAQPPTTDRRVGTASGELPLPLEGEASSPDAPATTANALATDLAL